MALLGLDGLLISFSTRIKNLLGRDCEFMMGNKSFVFRFADVEVREREFSLIKAGKVLAVEPKAFRVLLLLLRTPQKGDLEGRTAEFRMGRYRRPYHPSHESR
jgi:hypothetical protein